MPIQTPPSIMAMKTYLADKYFIPKYQRDYSWDEAELEDFWNDIISTYDEYKNNNKNSAKTMHFFGQIVIHNDTNETKKYIIDGQQRTITSVIFLRVLHCFFKNIDDTFSDKQKKGALEKFHDNTEYILGNLIGKYNPADHEDGDEQDLHLTLGARDQIYFRNNIQDRNLDLNEFSKKKVQQQFEKKFIKAVLFFKEEIDNKLSEYGNEENAQNNDKQIIIKNKMTFLTDLLNTFIGCFRILYMETTELSEAFTIFETLNARGKELETSDLLKNFLFSKTENNIQTIEKEWNEMTIDLGQINPTKYIRHLWNAEHSLIREKNLYRAISKETKTVDSCKKLIKKLSDNARYYSSMVLPEENQEFSGEVPSLLKNLKILKAKSFYPVILSMKMKGQNDGDIAKVLRKIEILVFRNMTICNKNSNEYERFFASIALEIQKGIPTDSIIAQINKNIIEDNQFKEDFNVWKSKSATKDIVRYILTKIYDQRQESNEIKLNDSTTEVHIEHIMPKSDKKWNIDNQIHEEYLWRLGNLTLLSSKLNRSISNKKFEDKKEVYANSKITLTKEIAEKFNTWGPDQIELRQKELGEEAIQIWKKD